jgi:hypothetical protein
MVNAVSAHEIKQAQVPHNLFIVAAMLFDLLMTPAAIAMHIGMYGLLVPLLLSGCAIGYIYLRSRQATVPFVAAHWKLAFKRCQFLMIGYVVTAVLIMLASLLGMASSDPNMKHIILIALTRIAIIPTLIAVMVTLLMEAGSLGQAGRGEAP